MKQKKQLGIWMDHSNAYLMELKDETVVAYTVASDHNLPLEEPNLKDESQIHNREQGQLTAYFKKLSEVIRDYEEVLLFGPTEAKNELLNQLKDNHLFDDIQIDVKPTDNMTEVQRETFVKEYFDKTSGKP